MPRTFTAQERAWIKAPGVQHYHWIEVENSDRTYKDLTTLGGVDWVETFEWTDSIDQPTGSFTINLRRDTNLMSLAPTIGGSTLNRNNAGAYAPLLDPGRNIRIYTAVVPPGVNPAAFKKLVMVGRVDGVKWNQNPVVLTGRCLSGWLVDAFIQQERVYANSGVAVTIESVMQAVMNDTPIHGTPTLYTPTTPGFFINNTKGAKQAQKSVLEALQQDYALAIGWVCRYRFDAADNYRLTFFDVNRTKTIADDTFDTSEYADILNIESSDAEVRNYILGRYYDTGGHQQTRFVQSVPSQGKYGLKYMEINLANGDPINTAAQMDTMLNAAVNDLGAPLTTQEVETLYYWPVQIGDLFLFKANGDHYDSDQKLAVVSFTHRGANGEIRTTMQCRGSVIGAYGAWFRRGTGGTGDTSDVPPTIEGLSVGFPAGTATVEVLLRGGATVGSWRIALSTTSQPTAAAIRAAPVYTGQNLDSIITQTVYSGQRLYIGVFAYTGTTGTGAESAQWDSSIVRDGTGGPIQPSAYIWETASSDTDVTLSIGGYWSPGAPPPYEYRYRISIRNGTGTFSAWQSTPALPQSLGTINRLPKQSKFVEIQVRQGSDDATIARDVLTITPSVPGVATDGLVDKATPYSQGGNQASTNDAARQAGSGYNRKRDDDVRSGIGGIETPGARINTGHQYTADGTSVLLDAALSRIGATLQYPGGAGIDALRPAEGGANVTETRTAADTSAVSGRAAATVKNEAIAGNLADTDLTAFGTAGNIDRTNKRVLRVRDSVANLDVDGATARYGFRLQDVADALKLPASETVYTGGTPVQSLKPGEAGANVTETRTSADTTAVAGRAAATTRDEAISGKTADTDLTGFNTAGNIDRTNKRVLRVRDTVANLDVDGATARYGFRLQDTADALKLPATETQYTGGTSVQALKPGEAGANVTETRTAADTGAVSGRPAATVRDDARYRGPRNAGHAEGQVLDNNQRSGVGGVPTRGGGFSALPLVDATGVNTLVDPVLGQIGPTLARPSDASPLVTVTQSLRANGDAQNTFKIYDLANSRIPLSGYQARSVKDGDAITWSPAFAQAPMLVISPGIGANTSQPDATKWSGGAGYNAAKAVTPDVALIGSNLAVGGTLRAKLRQKGGTTVQNQEFGAGNSLTTNGATAMSAALGANAPSSSGHYTVEYHYTISASGVDPTKTKTITMVVAIERVPGGSGTPVEVQRETYSITDDGAGTTISDFASFDIATTMGSTDTFQIRLVSKTISGTPLGTASGTINGSNPTDFSGHHGVTFQYGGADCFASMTPDTGDLMLVEAFARQ